MKIAGLIVNRSKDMDLGITKKVIDIFNSKDINVRMIDKDLASVTGSGAVLVSKKEFLKTSEAIFCLGGDGTLLNVADRVASYGIPLMGINLGHLGFLTEVDESGLDEKIGMIARDEYKIEERLMLGIILDLGGRIVKGYCLNDFVVSRGASPRLINIKAYIDGHYVDSFTGDGVIVSTPTGSTAYSLSCGGPIADPVMKIVLITPICPHNIYSRTILTGPSKTVRIEVGAKNEYHGLVTFDGQKSYQIKGPVYAEIKSSGYPLKMIKINDKNFYDLLRKKLYNRGE
jgi:NAD+ kinase